MMVAGKQDAWGARVGNISLAGIFAFLLAAGVHELGACSFNREHQLSLCSCLARVSSFCQNNPSVSLIIMYLWYEALRLLCTSSIAALVDDVLVLRSTSIYFVVIYISSLLPSSVSQDDGPQAR
jgi:hypothetical protein